MRETRDSVSYLRPPGALQAPAEDAPGQANDTGLLSRAKNAAVRLLAVRARSAAELDARLRRKGFAPEVAALVVDWCRDLGYVDDRRLAEEWIRSRLARQPSGRARLKHELASLGVADEVSGRVLDELLPGEDEQDLCLSAARAVAHRYRGLPAEVRRRRLGALLLRRGFPPELVERALAHVDSDCEKH